jgi:hypothetical protein
MHDSRAFGRAHAPPPFSAALLQDLFKDMELVRHSEAPTGHILNNKTYEG